MQADEKKERSYKESSKKKHHKHSRPKDSKALDKKTNHSKKEAKNINEEMTSLEKNQQYFDKDEDLSDLADNVSNEGDSNFGNEADLKDI